MSAFDVLARRFADEIRAAANQDRTSEQRGQVMDAANIASSSLVAVLGPIAQELGNLTYGDTNEPIPDHDKECIVRRTAQRLGVDPNKLTVTLHAVSAGDTTKVAPFIEYIIDQSR